MNNNFEVSLTKELCPICLKEQDGAIVMNTILNEREAENVKKLHKKVVGIAKKPCEECQKIMEQAFLFIGFDETKTNEKIKHEGEIYRTGHTVGVAKNAEFLDEFLKDIVPEHRKKGYLFVPYRIMEQIGLLQNIENKYTYE